MKYNKLVRDKIPAIICQNGEIPITRKLSTTEHEQALRAKLHEEVAEFCESGQLEELADILEVIYALTDSIGASRAELHETRQQKKQERGGFQDRIFLI